MASRAIQMFSASEFGAVFHRAYWPMFTTNGNVAIEEGRARIRFVNSLVPSVPRRTGMHVSPPLGQGAA